MYNPIDTTVVFPRLYTEQPTLDWKYAKYQCQITPRRDTATVNHQLKTAKSIEQLVYQEKAKFALEVRCPKTLWSETHVFTSPNHVVNWDPYQVDHRTYLIPGVILTQDIEQTLEELGMTFESDELFRIKAGYWLARGQVITIGSLGTLLHFKPNDSLPSGLMKILPNTGGGHLRFTVEVSKDLYPRTKNEVQDRDLLIAALVGAIGKLKQMEAKEEDLGMVETVIKTLNVYLKKNQLSVWEEMGDDWDPAIVATALEPFKIPEEET